MIVHLLYILNSSAVSRYSSRELLLLHLFSWAKLLDVDNVQGNFQRLSSEEVTIIPLQGSDLYYWCLHSVVMG